MIFPLYKIFYPIVIHDRLETIECSRREFWESVKPVYRVLSASLCNVNSPPQISTLPTLWILLRQTAARESPTYGRSPAKCSDDFDCVVNRAQPKFSKQVYPETERLHALSLSLRQKRERERNPRHCTVKRSVRKRERINHRVMVPSDDGVRYRSP